METMGIHRTFQPASLVTGALGFTHTEIYIYIYFFYLFIYVFIYLINYLFIYLDRGLYVTGNLRLGNWSPFLRRIMKRRLCCRFCCDFLALDTLTVGHYATQLPPL